MDIQKFYTKYTPNSLKESIYFLKIILSLWLFKQKSLTTYMATDDICWKAADYDVKDINGIDTHLDRPFSHDLA